jgi:hypothetical protein
MVPIFVEKGKIRSNVFLEILKFETLTAGFSASVCIALVANFATVQQRRNLLVAKKSLFDKKKMC